MVKRDSKKSLFFHCMKPNFNAAVYILTCAVHFAAVAAVIYNIYFAAVLIVELMYYFVRAGRRKIFIKMLIISLIIGLLNLFLSGGRIVLTIGVINITEYGVQKAAANAALVFGLFLFTGNYFSEKVNFIKSSSKSLVGMSLQYFRYLIEIIAKSRNVKMIIKKLIVIYKRGIPDRKNELNNKITLKFILYNAAAIIIFAICIFFLIKSNKFA